MIARPVDFAKVSLVPELNEDRGWFACYSRAGENSLRKLQIDCNCDCPLWVPKVRRVKLKEFSGSGKLHEVLAPLFPGYYLLGFPLNGITGCPVRVQGRRVSGCCQLPIDILPKRDEMNEADLWSEFFRPLGQSELDAILLMEAESIEDLVGASLVGRKVRLNEQAGAWRGFPGTMLELTNVGHYRLAVVRVQIFGREQTIRVPVGSLEEGE